MGGAGVGFAGVGVGVGVGVGAGVGVGVGVGVGSDGVGVGVGVTVGAGVEVGAGRVGVTTTGVGVGPVRTLAGASGVPGSANAQTAMNTTMTSDARLVAKIRCRKAWAAGDGWDLAPTRRLPDWTGSRVG